MRSILLWPQMLYIKRKNVNSLTWKNTQRSTKLPNHWHAVWVWIDEILKALWNISKQPPQLPSYKKWNVWNICLYLFKKHKCSQNFSTFLNIVFNAELFACGQEPLDKICWRLKKTASGSWQDIDLFHVTSGGGKFPVTGGYQTYQ